MLSNDLDNAIEQSHFALSEIVTENPVSGLCLDDLSSCDAGRFRLRSGGGGASSRARHLPLVKRVLS